jgi:hypothetical protein
MPYCACGRCYSPGSLVGDWLRDRTGSAWRTVRATLLRRPDRFGYRPGRGVALPAWVAELMGHPGQSGGTRYDDAR